MWFHIDYKPEVKDEWTSDDGTKLLLTGQVCGMQTEKEAITWLIRHFVSRRLKGVSIRTWR
jgi:hypothetical protein